MNGRNSILGGGGDLHAAVHFWKSISEFQLRDTLRSHYLVNLGIIVGFGKCPVVCQCLMLQHQRRVST